MFPKVAPRAIDSIVDEQVRRWEIAEQQRKKATATPGPVITVSREFGSLGAAIGRRVADRTGFVLWDQEVVHEIAQKTGASEKLVATLDEHARGALDDLIAGAIFGAKGTTDQYQRQLVRTVHAIAAHGSAVIVGRGAQFILPPDAALRVRVVCPLEKRIAGYGQREGVDARAAEKKIKDVEADRIAFVQQRYGKDVRDPVHYDVTINSGSLPLDGAADLVIAAYRARFRKDIETRAAG